MLRRTIFALLLTSGIFAIAPRGAQAQNPGGVVFPDSTTYGTHESYTSWAPSDEVGPQIIPHLVSRVLYCGSGGLTVDGDCQLMDGRRLTEDMELLEWGHRAAWWERFLRLAGDDLPRAQENYRRNLERFGIGEAEAFEKMVAWGDPEAIAARVREHLDAGADHVAVRVLTEDPTALPMEDVRAIAAAM